MRAIRIVAVLASPDPITDAELESIVQHAVDDSYLDIHELSITLVELPGLSAGSEGAETGGVGSASSAAAESVGSGPPPAPTVRDDS